MCVCFVVIEPGFGKGKGRKGSLCNIREVVRIALAASWTSAAIALAFSSKPGKELNSSSVKGIVTSVTSDVAAGVALAISPAILPREATRAGLTFWLTVSWTRFSA